MRWLKHIVVLKWANRRSPHHPISVTTEFLVLLGVEGVSCIAIQWVFVCVSLTKNDKHFGTHTRSFSSLVIHYISICALESHVYV